MGISLRWDGANGLLAANVVEWAALVGRRIEPHGVDLRERLIARSCYETDEYSQPSALQSRWTSSSGTSFRR